MIYNPDEHEIIIIAIIYFCFLLFFGLIVGFVLAKSILAGVSMLLFCSVCTIIMFVAMATLLAAEFIRFCQEVKKQNKLIDKQIILIDNYIKVKK